MTENEIRELVKYRFEKAKKTLHDVDIQVDNKLWNFAINRLYYSCYYAVSALLLNNGIFTKTHAGAKSMLGLHFVNTGKISKEANNFYSNIFDLRQESDYDDFIVFREEDVIILLEPAKNFVMQIEILLKPGLTM